MQRKIQITFYTEKKGNFSIDSVYPGCVAVCGYWDSILLTPTRGPGQRVLRISLSVSTCVAQPHQWKHTLLQQQHHPLAQSSAALQFFPWLTVTQTAWGVRPQPLRAKFRPCNWSLTFIPPCICVSQPSCGRACQVCMSAGRHIFRQQDSHKSSLQNAWWQTQQSRKVDHRTELGLILRL